MSVLSCLIALRCHVGTDDWCDCSDLDRLTEIVILQLRTPVAEPRRMVMREQRVTCD